jgi:hypothetical protein
MSESCFTHKLIRLLKSQFAERSTEKNGARRWSSTDS